MNNIPLFIPASDMWPVDSSETRWESGELSDVYVRAGDFKEIKEQLEREIEYLEDALSDGDV